MPVFGWVLVLGGVVVRVRMPVLLLVVLVRVFVVVIGVTVLVGVLDAVRVLVRMPVLLIHVSRFGRRCATALHHAATVPGLRTTFSQPSVLLVNMSYACGADSSGRTCVITFAGSISPLRMRSISGLT